MSFWTYLQKKKKIGHCEMLQSKEKRKEEEDQDYHKKGHREMPQKKKGLENILGGLQKRKSSQPLVQEEKNKKPKKEPKYCKNICKK